MKRYLITVEVESEWSLDLLTRGQYGALIFGANHHWKIVEAKERGQVMSEITIKSTIKEITGWTKEIRFEREGETHLVTLYWNSEDGYDLVFKNKTNQNPEWVNEWQDSQQYGAESLEYTLDCLTDGEGEGND